MRWLCESHRPLNQRLWWYQLCVDWARFCGALLYHILSSVVLYLPI